MSEVLRTRSYKLTPSAGLKWGSEQSIKYIRVKINRFCKNIRVKIHEKPAENHTK